MHPASDLASDLDCLMNAGLLQKAYEHEAWFHGMVLSVLMIWLPG